MLILWMFFAVLAAIFQIKRVNPFRFDYFSTLIWLLALSIDFLGFVIYPPLESTTIWFVVGCHLALLAGYNLVGAKAGGGYAFVGDLGGRTNILAMLAVVFVILVSGRAVLEGRIPFLGALDRLEMARSEVWDRGARSAGPLDQIVRIFLYAAIAYIMLAPLVLRQWWNASKGKKSFYRLHLLLTIATGLLLIDQALRDAGRALIVYIILGCGAIYLVIFPVNIRKAVIISLSSLFIIYFLSVTFYQYRNLSFAVNPRHYIEINCAGGQPSKWVLEGSDALKAATVSSCYFSSPIHNLDGFLRRNSDSWRHTYGLFNASIFAPNYYFEVRDDLAWYYRTLRQGQNPWATAARDYWLDWSWWSVIFFVLTGILFGLFSRKKIFHSETSLIRFGLFVIAAFFIPFQSPFINRLMIYPIAVTMLVDLACMAFAPRRVGRSNWRSPGTGNEVRGL